MEQSQQDILGDRAKRSPHKPTKLGDGGTALERDLGPNIPGARDKDSRCYTMVQSRQIPRTLVGPAASVKRDEVYVELSPKELRHKNFVKVRTCTLHLHLCILNHH